MATKDMVVGTDEGAPAVAHLLDAGRRIERAAGAIHTPPIRDAKPFVILRNSVGDERIEILTERFITPPRQYGEVGLDDVDSFIRYVNMFSGSGRQIYAGVAPITFTAVLNDFVPGSSLGAFRDLRATFKPTHSKEWILWNSISGKSFESSSAFAGFLQDNFYDVMDPPGGSLLEIALNLRMNESVQFSKSERLSDGNSQLTYNRSVEGSSVVGGATVKIPEKLTLALPMWAGVGSSVHEVHARLNVRLMSEGKVKMTVELIRPHKIVEAAFDMMLARVEKETTISVLYGEP